VILQYGDNTSSTSSDEGLTTLECETLRVEAASICPEKKEVNMNLRGGKFFLSSKILVKILEKKMVLQKIIPHILM
jgi:hypothetical protein